MKNTLIQIQIKRLRVVALSLTSAILLATLPAGATNGGTELVYVDFDNDTPGQPPSTGGPGQPTFLDSQSGTSILVQTSANGIATQPVVLTAQGAGQFAGVITLFDLVSEGVVRVEATVAFDRLADGFFLQTTAESGPFPLAVVTRLITTDFGEIQDDVTRTPVGIYAPNQPFRIRMDIDMSAKIWSVAVDSEMNGFDDDPVVSNLPFRNPVDVLPTVGGIWVSLSLFSTLSVAPTAVAYDDIRVLLPAMTVAVDIDIKPGSFPNSINPRSRGKIPVAILTTDTFDVTAVDPTTILFGATGTEAAPMRVSLVDVDLDGDTDLILHFNTQATGIQCGDISAFLIGETFNGQMIQGSDSIKTVGCK
jgi:hypothetical protein